MQPALKAGNFWQNMRLEVDAQFERVSTIPCLLQWFTQPRAGIFSYCQPTQEGAPWESTKNIGQSYWIRAKHTYNTAKMPDMSFSSQASSARMRIYFRYWHLQQTDRCNLISRTDGWTTETNWILVITSHTCWAFVHLDLVQMPINHMTAVAPAHLIWMKSIHFVYRSLGLSVKLANATRK